MPDATPRPEPFSPQAAPAALEDLRARLRATRWPDAPEDAGWSLGTDLGYLRELVAYWADGFDWPAQEAALARLPRFRVPLGGLGIHFVHARAAAPAGPVLPLVLSHGWPDSFWRYTKVIPLLTDPGAHGADPGRRVRRGRARHAGLRVLRPPDRPAAGLHRRRRPVGRADGRPRLPAVRRGGRGHRQPREPLPRARPPRPGRGRPPHRRGPARLHRRPGGPRARGARLARGRRGLGRDRGRLRRHAPHEAPDRRLRAHRLAGRARRVDRREAAGVERLRRRHRAELHQGRDPHQRHDLLAHRDDRLVDADVPRERRDPARAARPPGRGAVRLLALRRRRRPPAAGVARAHGERRAGDRARRAAGTSRRSRSPSSTRRSCASSSAPTGRRRRAEPPPAPSAG